MLPQPYTTAEKGWPVAKTLPRLDWYGQESSLEQRLDHQAFGPQLVDARTHIVITFYFIGTPGHFRLKHLFLTNFLNNFYFETHEDYLGNR